MTDDYLDRLDARIVWVKAAPGRVDEMSRQGVLSGLLAARALYVEHLEDCKRGRDAAMAADREIECINCDAKRCPHCSEWFGGNL